MTTVRVAGLLPGLWFDVQKPPHLDAVSGLPPGQYQAHAVVVKPQLDAHWKRTRKNALRLANAERSRRGRRRST